VGVEALRGGLPKEEFRRLHRDLGGFGLYPPQKS
jgi:hypothetical protein